MKDLILSSYGYQGEFYLISFATSNLPLVFNNAHRMVVKGTIVVPEIGNVFSYSDDGDI
jgi:hypothetical protein